MAKKRVCICCGNEYDYCPHCGDYKNQPRWKMNYDDEGCHVAFQTVTDYLAGVITKDAAKIILEDADLKYRSKFVSSVAKYVDEILDGKVAENKIDLDKINAEEKKTNPVVTPVKDDKQVTKVEVATNDKEKVAKIEKTFEKAFGKTFEKTDDKYNKFESKKDAHKSSLI